MQQPIRTSPTARRYKMICLRNRQQQHCFHVLDQQSDPLLVSRSYPTRKACLRALDQLWNRLCISTNLEKSVDEDGYFFVLREFRNRVFAHSRYFYRAEDRDKAVNALRAQAVFRTAMEKQLRLTAQKTVAMETNIPPPQAAPTKAPVAERQPPAQPEILDQEHGQSGGIRSCQLLIDGAPLNRNTIDSKAAASLHLELRSIPTTEILNLQIAAHQLGESGRFQIGGIQQRSQDTGYLEIPLSIRGLTSATYRLIVSVELKASKQHWFTSFMLHIY